MIADRVHRILPSFTLQMTARVADLRRQGIRVIDLGVGEPDFNTPEHIREAAKQAMDGGFTRYTPETGSRELREAICEKLRRDNDLSYTPEQVIVSNGGKHSLSTACQALFNPGDQVLVFAPYWVSFPEFVRLADGEPVIVRTVPEDNFTPDWNDLERKITPRVRGIIINSPSNPTGATWDRAVVERILGYAAEHTWAVISDETYERLTYDAPFTSTQAMNPNGATVLTVQSLSKTYAMTGWRMGYCAGAEETIRAMGKLQGQFTSCPNSISQKAAIAALTGDQAPAERMREAFRRRRDVMVTRLNRMPHVRCAKPGGAFYVFPNFGHYLGRSANGKKMVTSFDLSDYILHSARTVTVAGSAFGSEGHLRISYAADEALFLEGLDRIEEAVTALQ